MLGIYKGKMERAHIIFFYLHNRGSIVACASTLELD